MATAAQIDANRRNAQHSTGPVTAEGKAAVAGNAEKFNLFSRRHAVPAEDEPFYNHLRESIFAELQPSTLMEEALAGEILRAVWRLDRCAAADLRTPDTLDPGIQRARAEAHRLFLRSTSELRRLQTERLMRNRFLTGEPQAGLAEYTRIVSAIPTQQRWLLFDGNNAVAQMRAEYPGPVVQDPEFTQQTQFTAAAA